MDKVYEPKEGTIADQAIRYVDCMLMQAPRGAWIANIEVSTHLGVRPNAILPSLQKALDVGLIEKSLCERGFLQWRIGTPRKRPTKKAEKKPEEVFSIPNWPPGFVSQFDTVYVPAWEGRK